MAGDEGQFLHLLARMLNADDNDVRKEAESAYDNIENVVKAVELVKCIRNESLDAGERSLAAVLLRRLFVSGFDDLWLKFDENSQNVCKSELLLALQTSNDENLGRKIVDAISLLAGNLQEDDGETKWPEIQEFTLHCLASDVSAHRLVALRLLYNVPNLLGSSHEKLAALRDRLLSCLTNEAEKEVRYETVKTVCSIIEQNEEDKEILAGFKDLLPPIIHNLAESISEQETDDLLKALVDVAEIAPKFLKPELDNLFAICLKATADREIEDDFRQLALEIVVSLCESAPGMVRKGAAKKHIPNMIPLVLSMMTELDDDPESMKLWLESDEPDDEDQDSNTVVGESSLDRLCCALGGKTLLPIITTNLMPMLQFPDWKFRHAGLMAISACAEGCQKQMQAMLANVIQLVIPALSDEHPRVRYASCNAVGQMCSDFAPQIQKRFHETIIPAVVRTMRDACPRVQAHAAAALVNFCEECPKKVMTPYLETTAVELLRGITQTLQVLESTKKKLVLQQYLTTLSAVSSAAQDKFAVFYDRFMPLLKAILSGLENDCPKDLRTLRGKAIECISLMGLAVGKEKFIADAGEIMHLLLSKQMRQEDLDPDDPQTSYLITAWTRICQILGADFQQYLPLVMGPVMKVASIEPELNIVDDDEADEEDETGEWQYMQLGDNKSFGIRTSSLEDKASACEMLVCYARELKGAFAEYCEPVLQLMVPLLKFAFHERVRSAACECIPCLLEVAKASGAAEQAWVFALPALLDAMESETESDVKGDMCSAMAESIELLGKGCLDGPQTARLMAVTDAMFETHFANQKRRVEKRADEDYDEGVEEQLEEEVDDDTYVLSRVTDISHALFKTHGPEFLPVFKSKFMEPLAILMRPNQPDTDYQWGLCMCDDMIEFGGPAAAEYIPFFQTQMLAGVEHTEASIRQAACYGIGVMAQFGGEPFSDILRRAINPLQAVICAEGSREAGDVQSATENAIAALTKVCWHRPDILTIDQIGSVWLSWLPIREDEEEAVHVYQYLCQLIRENRESIVGASMANIPAIVRIFAEAFYLEVPPKDSPVRADMVAVVNEIQQNAALAEQCVRGMDPDHLKSLNAAVSGHTPVAVNGHGH